MAVRRIGKSWYVDFGFIDEATGERRRFRQSLGPTVTSRREADRLERLIRARLERGGPSSGAVTSAPFDRYARHWLTQVCPNRELARRTLASMEQHLRTHATPHFEKRPLHTITALEIDAFLKQLARSNGTPLSPKTKRNVRSTVLQVFRDALREGYCHNNPVLGSQCPKVRRTMRRRWSPEQVTRFLVVARDSAPKRYPFFLLLFHTGMRLGEARGLRWNDVNLDAKVAVVRRSASAGGLHGPTKNGHARRVPLSDALVAELTRLPSRRAGAEVFPGQSTRFLPETPLRALWRRLIDEAELFPMRMHDARHSAASLLHAHGATLAEIRDILGHSSIHMTERYVHGIPANARRAANRLPSPPDRPSA